jgi:hypothetical protein
MSAVSTPSIGLGKPPMFGKTRSDIAPVGRLLNPSWANILIRKSLSSFYLAPNSKLK